MKKIINRIKRLFNRKQELVFGGKTLSEIIQMNINNKNVEQI